MNWINSFEIICYFIVAILLIYILKNKKYKDLGLFISEALAGFSLEFLAVRLTDIYHYSNDFFHKYRICSISISIFLWPYVGWYNCLFTKNC